ncbi:hypothetical protein E2C01_048603 [Portunus trituberculatus]|uniref:Uncharacterized protein n=1 Tax=Portunus trituberculatus TaxID=210409 RepID=A0A5B7GAM9_PORTR|nr:hypothetical protein [Portunus trituberculatus]
MKTKESDKSKNKEFPARSLKVGDRRVKKKHLSCMSVISSPPPPASAPRLPPFTATPRSKVKGASSPIKHSPARPEAPLTFTMDE